MRYSVSSEASLFVSARMMQRIELTKADRSLSDEQDQVFFDTERISSILFQFLRHREARRCFGSSFGVILRFAFELKNMFLHIFRLEAKAPP